MLSERTIQQLTNLIFIKDGICDVDAIIVPGASCIELIEKVHEVIQISSPEVVVLSGKYGLKNNRVLVERLPAEYQNDYSSEAEMMYEILVKWGNNPDILIQENHSTNTRENFENSLKILSNTNKKIQTVGICCQSFHAMRCSMTASELVPEYIYKVFPANTQNISKTNWFESSYGINRVMGEIRRIGEYFPLQK